MIWTSVDPGKTGSLVLWEDSTPIEWHQFSVKSRFFISEDIDDLMHYYDVDHAVIEALMDRKIYGQSSIANNTTAANFGVHWGLFQSYGTPVEIVHASAWKTRLGLTKDKDLSLTMARDLFPMCADALKLKKHHDMAEALLIGHDYILRNTNDD